MLRFPADWIQHFGANLVSAFPPDLGARFRYYERLRPQPSFAAIVDRVLASDPDFRTHEVGEMVRFVTCEGEYGAWVAITGQRDGNRAMRCVGATFMGEFASALDVIAILPEHFAAVEALAFELVRGQRFDMKQRPRMFFYVPPIGWHGLPSGLTANWYPTDFPNNLSNIVVPPASFVAGDAQRVVEDALGELGAGLTVNEVARDELVSASGFKGTCARLHGSRAGRDHPIHRELVVFAISPYVYRMRFETTNAAGLLELRELFRAVAGSFRPLPTAEESQIGRAFSPRMSLFDHWAS